MKKMFQTEHISTVLSQNYLFKLPKTIKILKIILKNLIEFLQNGHFSHYFFLLQIIKKDTIHNE